MTVPPSSANISASSHPNVSCTDSCSSHTTNSLSGDTSVSLSSTLTNPDILPSKGLRLRTLAVLTGRNQDQIPEASDGYKSDGSIVEEDVKKANVKVSQWFMGITPEQVVPLNEGIASHNSEILDLSYPSSSKETK